MLIYLDTNIWIYAYEDHPEFGETARTLLKQLRARQQRLASSLFVLNELLVLPTRRSDSALIAGYQHLFASPSSVQLLPYTLAATRIYASLRAFQRVKPIDALHLATAAAAHVDRFVTQDSELLTRTVPGIGAIGDLASAVAR